MSDLQPTVKYGLARRGGKIPMSSGMQGGWARLTRALYKYRYAYLLLIPGIVMLIMFRYVPMYGVIMAFEKFRPGRGILGSPWVGFQNFMDFFNDAYSLTLFRNTFLLGIYTLIFSFPAPILLALSFNEIQSARVKKVAQVISYLPYFISTVIIVGIMKDLLALNGGIVNQALIALGGKKVEFFAQPGWFRPIYVISIIWQGTGFGSIIYLAAISGIDVEMYEAAFIDGSNRFKNLRYITLPSLIPTIMVMFILAIGGILGNDFTRILLIYIPSTFEKGDVLQTYVYRIGIQGAQFGYASAIGIFNALVSFIFLYVTNLLARRYEGNSLW